LRRNANGGGKDEIGEIEVIIREEITRMIRKNSDKKID
jgi:hypothetical protein